MGQPTERRIEVNDMTKARKDLAVGAALLTAFALWTALVQLVDVRPVGQNGTDIGFAAFNTWFHELTGVHIGIYAVTDWLGLVPVAVCLGFGALGAAQLFRCRNLLEVDPDLLLLGAYYVVVAAAYLAFEMFPVNYRPIPIDGVMEASYPSSTTLLVLSVMPTLAYQLARRMKDTPAKGAAITSIAVFSALIVVGRLVSGVHWATDIVGSVLLTAGLFTMYRYAITRVDANLSATRSEG